ncbi:MAG: cysteine desulfurase family protein (TIGR01976 family), partial [Candidatus Krumholzibacteriia bacterium]
MVSTRFEVQVTLKGSSFMSEKSIPDHNDIRSQFPALSGPTVYLENAGGSQVPHFVADRIHQYMTQSYVQLGAGYSLSQRCTATVEEAHAFARRFLNVENGHAILGPSTTALLHILAKSYAQFLQPGQQIIIAETGHEANMGCWKQLADQGAEIVWWRVDPETFECPLSQLVELMNSKTALVVLPHVSNLLGHVVDVAAVTRVAHAGGARVVVDGVALAPHRAVDVTALGVDWYVYSTYKVYGPHMAVLYGSNEAFAELKGPNHFFVAEDDLPYKYELGGANHESCAGLLGLGDYFQFVMGLEPDGACGRETIEKAFGRMQAWEDPLTTQLVAELESKPSVRLIGPADAAVDRVGTVSFVHSKLSSREIAAVVDRSSVAIRCGHMYAWHLCEALGIDHDDGVVRVSLVHYNTAHELEK